MGAIKPGCAHLHQDPDHRNRSPITIDNQTSTSRTAGIENFSEANIVAELERRGVPLPPAGFHLDTTGTTGLVGPSYVTDSWRVLTQWTPEAGVTYCIDNDNGVWTPAEIAELPNAYEVVKREIDFAAALVHLRNHPELATYNVSVTDLCAAAEAEGLGWGALAEAWGTTRDVGELADN